MRTLFPSHWSTTTRRVTGASLVAAAVLILFAVIFGWQYADSNERFAQAAARFEREVGPVDPARWETPAPRTSPAALELVAAVEGTPDAPRRTHDCALGTLDAGAAASLVGDPAARFDTIDLLRRTLDTGLRRWPRSESSRRPFAVLHIATRAACDGRLALARGDVRGAVEDVKLLGRLATVLADDVEITAQLRATAVESRQRSLIRAVLRSGVATRDDVTSIEAAIPRYDIVAACFRSEVHQLLTLHATLAGVAPGKRDSSPDPTIESYRVLRDLKERSDATRIRGDLLEILARDLRDFPRTAEAARADGLGTLDADLERRFADTDDMGSTLAGILLTGVGDRAKLAMLHLTLRDLAFAAIRARRLGLERGAYPPRLADILGEAGVDLVHREPISWTIHADGSATLETSERTRSAMGDARPRLDTEPWTLPPVTQAEAPR